MTRKMKKEKLAKQISLAIMTGMVTYTPVAFGMPVQDGTAAGVTVTTSQDKLTMDVVGENQNNIINWQDFSITKDETVNFEDNKNYANIVTGAATSFIDGHMTGGGDIYLINPNGVIFGKTADINVGNLYVSTQAGMKGKDYDQVKWDVAHPIQNELAADIVNLGNIQANTVQVVGNNIRFLNVENQNNKPYINATSVDIKAREDGYVHLGHEVAGTGDDKYNITVKTPDNYTITNISTSAIRPAINANPTDIVAPTGKNATNYMLVWDLPDLKRIKNNVNGNYMLADDINKNGSPDTFVPVVGFSGNFDGMFNTINNLNVSGGTGGNGIFASTSGSNVHIENTGLVNVNVKGSNDSTGGFIGVASAANTYLKNVYSVNGQVSGGKNKYNGGLVGQAANVLFVEQSFNASTIYNGGGIVGRKDANITLSDVYNTGNIVASPQYGILSSPGTKGKLTANRVYSTVGQLAASVSEFAYSFDTLDRGSGVISSSSAKRFGFYSGWGNTVSDEGGVKISSHKDANGNMVIDSVTKPTWRIYNGQSLPMLTAFFQGTIQASYDYTMGSSVSGKSTDSANPLGISKSNGNISAVYNGSKFEIKDWETGVSFGSDPTVITEAIDNYTTSDKISTAAYESLDRKNAYAYQDGYSYAMFTSGQLGYDIAGSNLRIEKRKVVGTTDTGTMSIPTAKVYDGTADIAINGNVSTSFADPTGITGIVAGDDVTLKGSVSGKIYSSKSDYEKAKEAGDTTKAEVVNVNENGYYYARLSFDGLTLDGTNKNNYDLTITSSSGEVETETASITKRGLLVSLKNTDGPTKVYDGTNALAASDLENYGWNNVNFDTSKDGNNTRGLISYIHAGEDKERTDEVTLKIGSSTPAYDSANAGVRTVAYSGMSLEGKDAKNYELQYLDGTTTKALVNGTLNGKGTITPRKITASTFASGITKTYDGTSKYGEADTVMTASTVTPSATETTGIIASDAGKLQFKLNGTAEFRDSDNKATANASDSDYASKATQIAFKITASAVDDTNKDDLQALKNYTFDGNNDLATTSTYDLLGAGTITKRNLLMTADGKTGIDKTYDTTNEVKNADYLTYGTGKYVSYASTATDDNKIVDGDKDVLNITAAYADENVAYDSDGKAIEKAVSYTATVNNSNYTINSGNTAILPGAKGIISPVEVSASLSTVTKEYDGSQKVTNAQLDALTVVPTTNETLQKDIAAGKVSLTVDKSQISGGTYASGADVVTDDTVNYTFVSGSKGISLTGTHAGNYKLSAAATGKGTITKRTVNTGDLVAVYDATKSIAKVYDGDADVKADGVKQTGLSSTDSAYLKQLYVNGVQKDDGTKDDIAFTIAEAVYANGANVADNTTANNVRYNLTLDSAALGNYDFKSGSDSAGNKITVNGTDISVERVTTGTITPKTITAVISNTTHTVKTYDGNQNVVDDSGNVLASNDLVMLTDLVEGESNASSAVYVDSTNTATKNATANNVKGAQGILYTISVKKSNGQDSSGNYVVEGVSNNQIKGTGKIDQAVLELAFAEPTKDYDTNSTATVSVSADGLKGDTFDSTQIRGTYGLNDGTWKEDSNAGAKVVKYADIDKSLGDNYGNYNVSYKTSGSSEKVINGVAYGAGVINKIKLVKGSNLSLDYTPIIKTYDGDTTVSDSKSHLTVKVNGNVWSTDNFDVSAVYQNKDAGGNKAVDYTITIADAIYKNVSFSNDSQSLVDTSNNNTIKHRLVTVQPGAVINKTYDGLTAVTSPITLGAVTGILADDKVTVTTSNASYEKADANADPRDPSTYTGKNKITYTITLDGADKQNYTFVESNYILSESLQSDGNIEKRALTVGYADGIDSQNINKTYDAAKELENPSVSYLKLDKTNVVTVGAVKDSVKLNAASGSYDSANAGSRTVTFNGFKVDNDNYYVSTQSLNGSGTIAQKVIDGSGKIMLADGNTVTKVYDGSRDATSVIAGKTLTSSEFITGDAVTLTATKATYNDANVTKANTITYEGLTLDGASAGNYAFATGSSLTGEGNITAKTIHAAASGTVSGKTYDGTELSLADLNIRLNEADIVTKAGTTTPDSVTLMGTISATKDGSVVTKIKDAGTYDLSYTGFSLNGTDKDNYKLVLDASTLPESVTINKKSLLAVIDATSREYAANNTKTDNVNANITGFVADSDYSVDANKTAILVGIYGKWSNSFTEDGNVSRTTNTTNYVAVDGKNYGYKAIKYDGFDKALSALIGENAAKNYFIGEVKGSNGSAATMTKDSTGLVQTAYFQEAAKMGYLTPIAITASKIRENWDSNITKVYDGTTSVNAPIDKMHLYYDANDNGQQDINEGSIAYEIVQDGATVYNHETVTGANSVTYKGVKVNSATVLTDNPNYEMDSTIFAKYAGQLDVSISNGDKSGGHTVNVAITARPVYVQTTGTAPSKVYDGGVDVANPSDYIELVKSNGNDDIGVVSGDINKVGVKAGKGVYDDVNAGSDKNVTYTELILTGDAASNYKLVNLDGTDTNVKAEGKGTIERRQIEVDINNRDVTKTYDGTANINKIVDATDDTKNLVKATAVKTTAEVSGGQITYEYNAANDTNTIRFKPTAGDNVIEIQLTGTFKKGNDDSKDAATGLGVDYVLSYDPTNIVLVHTTADNDRFTMTPAENARMSATLRGENIGTITPRTISVETLYAKKEYDGDKTVKGLDDSATAIKNVVDSDLVGTNVVNMLGLNVNGTYETSNANPDGDITSDATEQNVTYNNVSITNTNYTFATDGTSVLTTDNVNGSNRGIITRKALTVNPTPIKTEPGEQPNFSGQVSGFVNAEDKAAAAEHIIWNSPDYMDHINQNGSYAVYAYYNDAMQGNIGNNYKFANVMDNRAWTVGRKADPMDPSNPASPYSPMNPDSPFNPAGDMNKAQVSNTKFIPDERSYNRASHDDDVEHFSRQSSISIEYDNAGVNMGGEESYVGRKSLIGIESAGNVVNLGDAQMRASNIGIEMNGSNVGTTAEQAAIDAGLASPRTMAVEVPAELAKPTPVMETSFASNPLEEESVSEEATETAGISIITAEPGKEDDEEEKDREALIARADRDKHIGIETIGGGVNMAAAVR